MPRLNQEPHLPPRWRAVSLNETRCFNIAEEHRHLIKEIRAVYFYNDAEQTYCCSLTPSYDMRGLYHYVVLADDLSDEAAEQAHDEMNAEYCSESPEDCYMDCSGIDRKESVIFATEEQIFSMDEESCTEDAVREYWQGNWPF